MDILGHHRIEESYHHRYHRLLHVLDPLDGQFVLRALSLRHSSERPIPLVVNHLALDLCDLNTPALHIIHLHRTHLLLLLRPISYFNSSESFRVQLCHLNKFNSSF